MKLRERSHDSERDLLAERLARLEKEFDAAMGRIGTLEQENACLRQENERLKQELAAARKDSSTSSKPPSSDMVKPPKPSRKDGKKRRPRAART